MLYLGISIVNFVTEHPIISSMRDYCELHPYPASLTSSSSFIARQELVCRPKACADTRSKRGSEGNNINCRLCRQLTFFYPLFFKYEEKSKIQPFLEIIDVKQLKCLQTIVMIITSPALMGP